MKTTKVLIIFSAVLIFFSSNLFAASAGETISSGIGRGIVNMITSPAELPHHFIYDVEDQGAVGLLTGFGKGIFFTVDRLFAGLGDFVTLGFAEENSDLYENMMLKPFIWDEDWLPSKK